jgi:hypothetical protein
MGEKERAEALLQAAGVTGVAVQESAETVTMTRAEADALRAAAVPGAQAPAGIPAQVQQLGAELVAGVPPGTAPGQLPEGIMSETEMADHEREGDRRHAGMSHAEQMESVDRYVKSAEYHMGQGR